MPNKDIIDAAIESHCQKPRKKSAQVIADLPLIIKVAMDLADKDCRSKGEMRSAIELTNASRDVLAKAGFPTPANDLSRKVCGRILRRYLAQCFIKNDSAVWNFDHVIETRASLVYTKRLGELLNKCRSEEAARLSAALLSQKLYDALWLYEAAIIIRVRDPRTPCLPDAIKLGREIFRWR